MNLVDKRILIMKSLIISLPFIIILLNTAGNISAQDDKESYIYLIGSEPFGIPYYQWTESWWNWLHT